MTKPDASVTRPQSDKEKRPFFLHTRPAAIAAIVLALILGVCYALAMRFDFDFPIGHFALDSILFHIVIAVCAIGVAASALAYFSSGTKILDPLPESGPRSLFAGLLAAAMCLVILCQAIRVSAAAIPEKLVSPENLSLLSAVLGLFLAASVILSWFPENRGMKTFPVVSAVLGALSVNIAMFACYFDFTVPLNSPVRNLTTLMQASILLFLFSEARLLIVKGPKDLPVPFQLATQFAAVILGMGISLGGILWRVIRWFTLTAEASPACAAGPEPTLPLSRLVLYFALSVLALDRLLAGSKVIRSLTKEEIEEAERKAKEAKEKKKKKAAEAESKA